MNENNRVRRELMKGLALSTGATIVAACAPEKTLRDYNNEAVLKSESGGSTSGVPASRPRGWNPIEFNRNRGLNEGTIPESYHQSINGADGDLLHVGKHLPYLAPVSPELVPEGYVAIMMGDLNRGYAQHPNSEEHWYNWIDIGLEGDSNLYRSRFSAWPDGSNIALGGGDVSGNGGKDTIYLIELPPGAKAGLSIRVIANCNKHGQYVDFLSL